MQISDPSRQDLINLAVDQYMVLTSFKDPLVIGKTKRMANQLIVPRLKRLNWDIEVTPNVVLAFRAGYDQTINHDAIIQERKVICIGYKWEGDRKATVLRWDRNKDDLDMLRRFADVANSADELVAHFGDRFDLPWFRTRCLILGLPAIPAYKTIDTKAWASKHFYFNSNKLDYLSKILGHGGKEKMEFDDWKVITLGKPGDPTYEKALNKMCHYCGIDVEKLELVFKDLEPYMKPKSHVGALHGLGKWTCPWTGSKKVEKVKTRTTAAGTIQHQMKSLVKGGYYTINDATYEAYKAYRLKQKENGSKKD